MELHKLHDFSLLCFPLGSLVSVLSLWQTHSRSHIHICSSKIKPEAFALNVISQFRVNECVCCTDIGPLIVSKTELSFHDMPMRVSVSRSGLKLSSLVVVNGWFYTLSTIWHGPWQLHGRLWRSNEQQIVTTSTLWSTE